MPELVINKANGSVEIYHNGSERLTTTSTGATVGGTGVLIVPAGTTLSQRPSGSTHDSFQYY